MIYAVNKRTKAHEVMDPNALYSTAVWEDVHATPDGWIEWQGGECPLPDDAYTDYKMRDGRISSAHASRLRWDNSEDIGEGCPEADIIAYRPILDTKVSHPGTMSGPDKYRSDGGEWPAWDGEGDKPPVGSRCMKDHAEVLVIAHANVGSLYDPAVVYQPINHPMGIDWKVSKVFSPIRSEEDRAVKEMSKYFSAASEPASYWEEEMRPVYAAIRDGKVPGVKLTGGGYERT